MEEKEKIQSGFNEILDTISSGYQKINLLLATVDTKGNLKKKKKLTKIYKNALKDLEKTESKIKNLLVCSKEKIDKNLLIEAKKTCLEISLYSKKLTFLDNKKIVFYSNETQGSK